MSKIMWTNFKKSMIATFSIKNVTKEVIELPKIAKLIILILLIFNISIFLINNDKTTLSYIGLFANLITIVNIILLDFGKITKSFWGVLSVLLCLFIAFKNNAIGDQYMQTFAFFMQFIGSYLWFKDIDTNNQVKSKKINLKVAILSILLLISVYTIVLMLSINNGAQPIIMSALLPLNIVSTLLMILKYKEHWYGWILINIINIVIWFNFSLINTDGAVIMLALQCIMLINSIYGLYSWSNRYKKQLY